MVPFEVQLNSVAFYNYLLTPTFLTLTHPSKNDSMITIPTAGI